MIIQVVGIVARPEERIELGKALCSCLGPTRVEPGCVSCTLYQDWWDPNAIYIESRWESQEDLIQHVKSENYRRLLRLMESGIEAPTIEFLTVSDVKGLDFIKAVREK